MSPPPTETAPGPTRGGLNARLVLHTVRHRPLAITAFVVLGVGTAAAAWSLLPLPKLTAAVVFQVASHTPTLLGQAQGEAENSFASYKQSQASLIKRRLTLNAALNQPGVSALGVVRAAKPDPLSWLDQMLKIDAKTGSEFMRVTLEGDDGDELQTLLTAVAKAYLADVDERHNGGRRRRLGKLEDTRRVYQGELDRYYKRMDDIAYALGSKEGPTLIVLDSIHQAELRDAGRDMAAVRDEIKLADFELAELDAQLKQAAPPVPPALVEEALREDSSFRPLEAEVAGASKVLAETLRLFEPGASPPTVVRARDQLAAAEEKLGKYRADRRPEIEARLRQRARQGLETRLIEVRGGVDRLRRKERVALDRIKDAQERIARSNQFRLELEKLKRSIDQTDKLAFQLGDEVERLKVELGAPARVTMAEEPFIVPGIEGNKRLRAALVGGLGVFFLGLAGLVGWEARTRKVTHADDVTTDIGVRLIGTVPPTVPGGRGATPRVSTLVLAEAVDTARTMLLHGTARGGPLRTILVTSAVAGEGKTSFSGHLALSLARAGFRTLLIDGDLQSPSAQQLYDLPDGPGFCELLRGEADPPVATCPSPIPNLSVLPAGRWDLAARQALAGDRWSRLRQELEAQFDYLVIDTAPLLLVSDTFLLAREADGVVLSVLLGVSHVALVSETVTKLKAIGVNVTGAVVNGVVHQAHKPGYGYRTAPGGDREPAGGEAVTGGRGIQK